MTKTERVDTQALDIWLTEHAFGALKPEVEPGYCLATDYWVCGSVQPYRWVPRLAVSTNPAASDALLEAMRAKRWSYSISSRAGLTSGPPHFCQFVTFAPDMIEGCEFADTKNLAIALAARKALEAEG